jgi:hypothetical protein
MEFCLTLCLPGPNEADIVAISILTKRSLQETDVDLTTELDHVRIHLAFSNLRRLRTSLAERLRSLAQRIAKALKVRNLTCRGHRPMSLVDLVPAVLSRSGVVAMDTC